MADGGKDTLDNYVCVCVCFSVPEVTSSRQMACWHISLVGRGCPCLTMLLMTIPGREFLALFVEKTSVGISLQWPCTVSGWQIIIYRLLNVHMFICTK